MKGYVLTPAAAADVSSIWDYTADHWSADQADRYTDDTRDACRDLAERRRLGRPVTVREGYMNSA